MKIKKRLFVLSLLSVPHDIFWPDLPKFLAKISQRPEQISEALIAINVSSLGIYILKYVESDKNCANKSFLAVFAVRDQQSVTLDECYCKFLFWSQLRLSWDEINFFLIIPWEDQPELSFEHFFSLKFDWFSLYLTVYVILSLAAQFNDTFSAMTEIKIWAGSDR